MGACLTRLEREMKAPPPNSGNWDQLGPRRLEVYGSQEKKNKVDHKNRSGNALRRIETPSAVPGLTFDHAGRPVWREENAVKVKRDDEHRERS